MALPSSRVTPGDTCPALRPRWSPVGSPKRLRDCCLPVARNRRLSPRHVLRVILMSTIIKISGLHHAACILVPSSFVRPLLGVHVEFTPDRLARRWSGGTCTVLGAHPLGSNNLFHEIALNPKASGLPWRDLHPFGDSLKRNMVYSACTPRRRGDVLPSSDGFPRCTTWAQSTQE